MALFLDTDDTPIEPPEDRVAVSVSFSMHTSENSTFSVLFDNQSVCEYVCASRSVGMPSVNALFRPVGVRGRGNRRRHIHRLCPDAGRPQVWPQFKVRN